MAPLQNTCSITAWPREPGSQHGLVNSYETMTENKGGILVHELICSIQAPGLGIQ